jgi:hypothetical protein
MCVLGLSHNEWIWNPKRAFSNYRRRLGAENNSPGDYDNIDGSVIDHLVRDADIFLLGVARLAENLNSVATVSASKDQRRSL